MKQRLKRMLSYLLAAALFFSAADLTAVTVLAESQNEVGWTVQTSSSIEDYGWGKGNLLDGRKEPVPPEIQGDTYGIQGYHSEQGIVGEHDEWIELENASDQTIVGLAIYPYDTEFPVSYKVETREGDSYQVQAEASKVILEDTTPRIIRFGNPVTTTQVKFTATLGDKEALRLCEIEPIYSWNKTDIEDDFSSLDKMFYHSARLRMDAGSQYGYDYGLLLEPNAPNNAYNGIDCRVIYNLEDMETFSIRAFRFNEAGETDISVYLSTDGIAYEKQDITPIVNGNFRTFKQDNISGKNYLMIVYPNGLTWEYNVNYVQIKNNQPETPLDRDEAVTFYVDSERGNDESTGMSENEAWKTLEKVNSETFIPGDKILFKRGGYWQGQLAPKGSGSSEAPIKIDVYGEGSKPVIDGSGSYGSIEDEIPYTAGAAVLLYNQDYWEIRNLSVTNSSTYEQQYEKGESWGNIIDVPSDSPENKYRYGFLVRWHDYGTGQHVYIEDCDIYKINGILWRFCSDGILVVSTGTRGGTPTNFNDVKIKNNSIKDINRTGISVWSQWAEGRGIDYPDNSAVPANYYHTTYGQWTPSTNVVVDGNYLENIAGDGILINTTDGAVIQNNITNKCQAETKIAPNVAIWPHNSDNTVIQNNEVYGTLGCGDGQGFDVDFSCNNTTFQYNYSHDNEGGFLLIMNGVRNTSIRYNVSQNDGYYLFDHRGEGTYYNNTFYMNPATGIFRSMTPSSAILKNNIFAYSDKSVVEDIGWNRGNTTYFNNLYHNAASLPTDALAIVEDPKFTKPGKGESGTGVGQSAWGSVKGYLLQPDSPAINMALDIKENGGKDYFGKDLSAETVRDLGACESMTEGGEPRESQNLPVFWKVEASSSVEGWGWSKDAILDGNKDYYASQPYGWHCREDATTDSEEWISINFNEKIKTVSGIKIYSFAQCMPLDFTIETWDGEKWITQVSETNYPVNEKDTDIAFYFKEAVETTAVRIHATKLNSSFVIAEVEIFEQSFEREPDTFYVDSVNGSDANEGTSEDHPWRTLEKVNSETFIPGDKILLKADSIWQGQLSPKGSGTEADPITIDMYGEGGKPCIDGNGIFTPSIKVETSAKELNQGASVLLYNQDYWEISNLRVTNNATDSKSRFGILVRWDDYGTGKHVYIRNCDIYDIQGDSGRFSADGILVVATGYWDGSIATSYNKGVPTNFDDILIEGNTFDNINRTAISIWSQWAKRGNQWWPNNNGDNFVFHHSVGDLYQSTNVRIRQNEIDTTYGDGILVSSCDGAVIEYNHARNCNTSANAVGANVAIWPILSDNTLIQYNSVYGTNGTLDGQAFDIDLSCYNTTIQYNYTQNNRGGFLLVMQDTGNSTVRYNVSVDDHEGLFHMNGSGLKVYNNTFIMTAPLYRAYWNGQSPEFYNNIFYALDELYLNAPPDTRFGYNSYYNILDSVSDGAEVKQDPQFRNLQALLDVEEEPVNFCTDLENSRNIIKAAVGLTEESFCINAGRTIENNGGKDIIDQTLDDVVDLGAVDTLTEGECTNYDLSANYAYGGTVTIPEGTTVDGYGWGSWQLVDGDHSKGYSSYDQNYEAEVPTSIEIALTKNVPIGKVDVHWQHSPKKFSISSWDGTEWTKQCQYNLTKEISNTAVPYLFEKTDKISKIKIDIYEFFEIDNTGRYFTQIEEVEAYIFDAQALEALVKEAENIENPIQRLKDKIAECKELLENPVTYSQIHVQQKIEELEKAIEFSKKFDRDSNYAYMGSTDTDQSVEGWGWSASYLVDGKISYENVGPSNQNGYSSPDSNTDPNLPIYIKLTLNDKVKIGKLNVYWYNSPKKFTISSWDGENWIKQSDISLETPGEKEKSTYMFENPIETDKIRIDISELFGTNTYVTQISEIEAYILDTAVLKETLGKAKEIENPDEELMTKIDEVEEFLVQIPEDVKQSQIDQLVSELQSIMNQQGAEEVDKTELNAEVERLSKLDLSGYTEESAGRLRQSLEKAKDVSANVQATEEEVKIALEEMMKAEDELEEKTEPEESDKEHSDNNNPDESKGKDSESTTANVKNTKAANTGDVTKIWLAFMLMLTSGLAAGTVCIIRYQKSQKK